MDSATWVPVPASTDFGIDNLPYGIGTLPDGRVTALVAIGDHALDLAAAHLAGLFADVPALPPAVFATGTLNGFMALGTRAWAAMRARLVELLCDERDRGVVEPLLVERREVAMRLPVAVGDYVDFYSSEHHATNLGRILRPGSPALMPNWRQLPVSYHGRAGTVVVSGTPIVRPKGLVPAGDEPPEYRPTAALDIELEVGAVVGVGSRLGEPIAVDDVAEHLFGLVLLNDWSARDIQAYEYQPLGPHLGKSFATSISPWIVTMAALEPFLVAAPEQDPEPDPYLRTTRDWGVDIELRVELASAAMRADGVAPAELSAGNFRTMYWTVAQQLAHLTANGASTRPGDLFGSGTVSGPEPGSEGSLIEITKRGAEPLTLPDGSTRAFLDDGDEVVLRGWCGGDARPRVGFGEVTGTIEPAR